jgi:hypothetical protein
MELGPHPAQRPVRLRGQQQDDQRGVQAERSLGEPDTGGDRHQRHRQGGHQLEHQRRGEGDPQGAQRRDPVAVGDLGDPG